MRAAPRRGPHTLSLLNIRTSGGSTTLRGELPNCQERSQDTKLSNGEERSITSSVYDETETHQKSNVSFLSSSGSSKDAKNSEALQAIEPLG